MIWLLRNFDGSCAGRARLLAALRPGGGGLMWRTAKADVADELGLPPQHARLSRLGLSAIERHFYNRQHQVAPAPVINNTRAHQSW